MTGPVEENESGTRLHENLETAALNLAAWSRALPLMEHLNEIAIPFIVLKSLPQVEDLYGGPGGRLSVDVDLVVRGDDVATVARAAISLGWKWDETDRARFDALTMAEGQRAASVHRPWHLVKPFEGGQSIVDLHSDAMGPTQRAALDSGIWERAQPTARDGVRFFLLAPEDRLLFLCAHFIFEGLEIGFLWHKLIDIGLILQRNKLDWEYVGARARKAGVTTALNIVCDAAMQRLGLPLVPVWRERVPPVARRRHATLSRIFRDRADTMSTRERSLFRLLLHDRPLDMLPAWRQILVPDRAVITADYLGYWPTWPEYIRQLGRIYVHRMRATLGK